MNPIRAIANYILQLAEADGDSLTAMQLHKHLYYQQGWSMALRKTALFSDRIEAWTYGPVVPKLGPMNMGAEPIPPDRFADSDPLPPVSQDFVRLVYNRYRGCSAWKLGKMTHSEAPWRDARGDLERTAKSSAEITTQSLKEYFGGSARIPGLDPLECWEAERQADEGHLVTHDELWSRLDSG